MRQIILICSIIFSILTFSSPLLAFYCGSDIITEGDSKIYVLSRCGEPDFKEQVAYKSRGSYRERGRHLGRGTFGLRGSYREESVIVEKWSYNFGPRQFIEILIFEGDTLVKMETGSYGYLKKK